MLQASISGYLSTQTQGTAPPPQEDSTQDLNLNPTPNTQQEYAGFASTYAQDHHYNEPHQPSRDYLHPSTVPQDIHNQPDLNYISWVVRHAFISKLYQLVGRSGRHGRSPEMPVKP